MPLATATANASERYYAQTERCRQTFCSPLVGSASASCLTRAPSLVRRLRCRSESAACPGAYACRADSSCRELLAGFTWQRGSLPALLGPDVDASGQQVIVRGRGNVGAKASAMCRADSHDLFPIRTTSVAYEAPLHRLIPGEVSVVSHVSRLSGFAGEARRRSSSIKRGVWCPPVSVQGSSIQQGGCHFLPLSPDPAGPMGLLSWPPPPTRAWLLSAVVGGRVGSPSRCSCYVHRDVGRSKAVADGLLLPQQRRRLLAAAEPRGGSRGGFIPPTIAGPPSRAAAP